MGLGPVSLVSVPQAKAIVLRHRTLVHEGRCPLCEKRGRTRAPKPVAFKEVGGELRPLPASAVAHAEHRRQWDVALATHAKAIWDLPVATIDTGAVMQVLEPEWRDEGADLVPRPGPRSSRSLTSPPCGAGAAARTRPAGAGIWTSSCPRRNG